jgi:hypothetical protein
MRRWLVFTVSVAFVGAACSEQPREPDDVPGPVAVTAAPPTTTTGTTLPPSTTTSATSTTLASSPAPTSSTTKTTVAVSHPPFLRYGSFGVIEVEAGRETVLIDGPIGAAWSDGAGGLVFLYDWLSEVPGIWRLPAGAEKPLEAIAESWGGAVVNLDGRAAVVRYDAWEERRCESGSIGVYDLETGLREDFVICSGDGDVGWFPGTYGGGLFAGVRWDDSGSCRTISGILFWDRTGAEVDLATNPYPAAPWDVVPDWIPCELDARLSPDGRLLAYRYRPDNKWPCPEYDDVPYEAWLEESRTIPGEVVVMDIKTGTVVYRAPSEAEERLTDFDGRYLVLTTTDRRDDVPLDQLDRSAVSTIVDITGSDPDNTVEGRVRLIWTAL